MKVSRRGMARWASMARLSCRTVMVCPLSAGTVWPGDAMGPLQDFGLSSSNVGLGRWMNSYPDTTISLAVKSPSNSGKCYNMGAKRGFAASGMPQPAPGVRQHLQKMPGRVSGALARLGAGRLKGTLKGIDGWTARTTTRLPGRHHRRLWLKRNPLRSMG